MGQTRAHTFFAHLRRMVPGRLARLVRASATAILTPLYFTRHTGHWRSSLRQMAVSPNGDPLPWYTYPCIDFLAPRRHRVGTVLEFGAGQSTLWWAAGGAKVVAFEADREWFDRLRNAVPASVDLRFTTIVSEAECIRDVREQLAVAATQQFDVVVVDGLWRHELITVALERRSPKGIIVFDDSEGYGVFERLKNAGLCRVDFFGFAPGVMLPRCTSIYFTDATLFLDAQIPIGNARG